jgi:hypothetical protein
MSFLTTSELLTALKAFLASLPLNPLAPLVAPDDATTERLFERVEFFDAPETGTALRELLITKQRVCFIVPSGEDYDHLRSGDVVTSTCTQEFDLVFADRAWVKGTAAVFGGPNNVGVVPMKDRVRPALFGQSLGLDGVALVPIGGSFATIADEKAKDVPGRETYVMTWHTWAGEERVSVAAGL